MRTYRDAVLTPSRVLGSVCHRRVSSSGGNGRNDKAERRASKKEAEVAAPLGRCLAPYILRR
eukprot:14497681-Heterocapsa_arctica.AAC.1